MELTNFFSPEGLTLGGVISSLLAALVWLVTGRVLLWIWNSIVIRFGKGRVYRWYRKIGYSFAFRYSALFLTTTFVALVVMYFLDGFTNRNSAWMFMALFTATTIMLHALFRDWSFNRNGLVRAEKSVSTGTDYEGSLRLCKHSIAFMGTGAYKLTSSKEFEAAAERCMASGGNVRILISRPDVPPLKRAEKMADVGPGDYSTKVRSTLKHLRTLKRDRAFPIEVRFHNRDNAQRMQEFRMMFVDKKHLFLSYNIYGRGDGSDIAQLVLQPNARLGPRRSFFYPFSELFERVWGASTRWNFDDYIGD